MSSAFLRCMLVRSAATAILGVAVLHCGRAAAAGPVDAPRVLQGPSEPAPPAGPSSSAIRIYRASCLKCHDTDGRGEIVRDVMAKVPDFTDAAWQSSRSDAELGRSILEGKGKSMPPMRDKLGPVDVGQMVAFVRAFRGGTQVVEDDKEEEPTAPRPSAGPAPATEPRSTSSQPAQPGPNDSRLRDGSRIFQRSCAACHGGDGRGAEMRDSLPSIPDFNAHAWQESRNDPQLVTSVLDGKGTGMPPFRQKVSREQARDLVAFIRSLDPSWTRATGTSADDFEARFQQLLGEFEDLRRQSRALSADGARTPDGSSPPGSSPPPPPSRARRVEAPTSGDRRPGTGG